MPFKSKAQRRFMYAEHPEMAKEWEKETPKGKKLPNKVKKKKAEWGLTVEEEAGLPRIGAYNPQTITADSLKTAPVAIDPNKLGADYDGAKKSVKGSKGKAGIGKPGPVALGPLIQGGIGLVNTLLGPEQPRRYTDETLAYNPYPQGTGSQALFEDGGKPKTAKKVTAVPEGYKPYKMDNGIPGASYYMKETNSSSAIKSPATTSVTPRRKTGVGKKVVGSRPANSARQSTLQDYVYMEPTAQQPTIKLTPPTPQKGFDGEPVYLGNQLAYQTQMQTRNSQNTSDAGLVNTSKSMAVMHPVFPNTATPNMDETYEVPADIYSNYFTGGSNHLQGRQDSLQTYRVPKKLAKGGKVKTIKSLGLQAIEGGSAPLESINSFDGGSGEFKGDSHAKGGIKAVFNGTPFEAEGGEPWRLDPQGNLEIFGNLRNPLTGNKFKKDAKTIIKKEQKAEKYVTKGLDIVNNTPDTKDKYEVMKFNSGRAMMEGGLSKQKELVKSKEMLSSLQRLILEEKGDNKVVKNGGTIFADGGKPWRFDKTNTEKLDDKIKQFVKMVEAKGLEGYSGEKGGYDKRNTKSGRPSRHGQNQALDMIFKDSNAYEKIMNDPELSSFLYSNGLTAINEYDPKIAQNTGATTGHIHVGYDKGTKTSDTFRNDYKTKYNPSGKPTLKNPTVARAFGNARTGDAYTEGMPKLRLPNTFYTPDTRPIGTPQTKDPTAYPQVPETEFQPIQQRPFTPPRRSKPWEQIAPVIPQAFEQADYTDRQGYQPELKTPYQVSFQDRINQNARTFNALAPSLVGNAEAQGVLAAQQYDANSNVLADEFRTNQGISNSVTNDNVSIINDAKLKNIQLADNQFVRQSQARGNTRDRNTAAGIQIGDLIAKNNLENKTLDVTQQLYRRYAFDENNQLQYVGQETAGDSLGAVGTDYGTNTKNEVTAFDPNTYTKTKRTYEPPNFQLDKVDILRGSKTKNWLKIHKNGGKVKQSTIAKLMNS